MNDTQQSQSRQGWNAMLVLVAAGLGLWLWFMNSEHGHLTSRADIEADKLSKMEKRKLVLEELHAKLKHVQPKTVESKAEGRPLIEVVEETAFSKRVRLNSISPRTPIRAVKKTLGGTRTTTEHQTWVQIGHATLKDLMLFLHDVEQQVPAYFVKELSGLSANQGKGDSWRVRVVFSRIEADGG